MTAREIIIGKFPGLAADPLFKITSPVDQKYNCIAWAAIKTHIFLWPTNPRLDGTDWPTDVPRNENLDSFVLLYNRTAGYAVCDDWKFEEGYQKIAIYINPVTSLVTHAARQSISGAWTSKLGGYHDIEHRDPFTIEGVEYGKAEVFMKRPNSSFKTKK